MTVVEMGPSHLPRTAYSKDGRIALLRTLSSHTKSLLSRYIQHAIFCICCQVTNGQPIVSSMQVIGVGAAVLGDMSSRPYWGLYELDFVFSTIIVSSSSHNLAVCMLLIAVCCSLHSHALLCLIALFSIMLLLLHSPFQKACSHVCWCSISLRAGADYLHIDLTCSVVWILKVGSIVNLSLMYLLAPVASSTAGKSMGFIQRLFSDQILRAWGAPTGHMFERGYPFASRVVNIGYKVPCPCNSTPSMMGHSSS